MTKLHRIIKKAITLTLATACALTLCTGCSNERKENQKELRLEGIAYMEGEKYENALKKFEEALELSLGEIGAIEKDICFYKAEAQFMLGDKEGAIQTYTAIIEFDESPQAYYLRGNLYYNLGEDEKALADYEKALEKDKDNYDLYIGVYEVLSAKGKDKEAQDCLNKALEIKGNSAQDKLQKGRITLLLGEKQAAIALFEEAVNGKEYQALYYLASIYSDLGDEASAESNMDAYIESGVADSNSLYEIANKELAKGKYDIAIECLKAALKLEKVPNKQILTKTLVIAYEHKLDFESALEVMKEYVEAYPDDEEAQRELTFLETRVPQDESEKTENSESNGDEA